MAAPPPPPGAPPPPPPGPPPKGESGGGFGGRARRMSAAFTTAFAPKVGQDVDALGIGGGSYTSSEDDEENDFDAADLFSIEVEDEGGEMTEMFAGEGLTSMILREDEHGNSQDWASELLLLTHEPMRRDMLEMQRALQTKYFGELPEGWRVRAFFRFFTAWCSLVSQQHAIEVEVHYNWLASRSGKMKGEQRQELLSYHRSIELELLAISRLEKKIIDELAGAADWTTSEPWSEQAQVLRDRLTKLCAEIRMHLATQETLLPDILRETFPSSPPQLVDKALTAAKKAQSNAARLTHHKPKVLMWMQHYLEKRSPSRAKAMIAKLPMTKRMAVAFGRLAPHADLLKNLRAIIDDLQPGFKDDPSEGRPSAVRKSKADDDDEDDDEEPVKATANEKRQKAGMVNAVLAAANARRVDVPLNGNEMSRALAASEDPLHKFKMDGNWVNKAKAVPDNLYKKIGIDNIDAPRRL